ncbi:MAG: LysR family transcriptional regulator [Candidatus Weimeria sp.]
MNVNYEYYRIFYQVYKQGSFTRAAAVLRSNQPNITRAMNNLEDQTGCRLFIRGRNGVIPTPEGKRLYEHVSAAIEQFNQAEHELSDMISLDEGIISIGATETALNIFLLKILSEFHLKHNAIRLHIDNYSTIQAVDAVKNSYVDFAVVTTPTPETSGLEVTDLDRFREILIGGSNFSSFAGQKLSIRSIADYPLIAMGASTMTYHFYQDVFFSYGLDYRPDTEVATADQILPLVKNNLGLAFIPEPMAEYSIKNKEVVKIDLEEKIPDRKICMIRNAAKPMGIASEELFRMISSVAL